MTTLGSTAEPTSAQEWFGLNTTNHFAILVTLPAGGPWLITRLGAWLAGKDEACNFKLCVWSAAGSLVAQTTVLTAASQSFALGHNTKYEADLTAPYEIDGGRQVYIGFARDPADNVQFGTRSGSRLQKYSSSWPVSLAPGYSSVSAAIGAYLYYETANQAPNAPTSLSPSGDSVVTSGTAPTVSGTRSDPDSGDYITAYQILCYEDDGTTLVYDSGQVGVSGSPTSFSRAISLPTSHAYYKWKARTRDKENVWGPYSALQRFYANSVPATPGAPTVSSSSVLAPTFSGGFSDPGDSMTAIQIHVERVSDGADTWLTGDIAKTGSSWSQIYGGTALAWGTQYRVRYRTKDAHGSYSSWGAFATWTPTQPQGPDQLSPTSTNPRQSSLTPTLTVGHSSLFRNDEIDVRTADNGGGTLIWDKNFDGADYANTTSKARVYAGTALSYGQTYYWRARVELSDGTISEWSDWYPFRINATPNAPTGLTPTGGIVLTDTTPDLKMNFSDPDTDQGDSPSLVDVEVYNNGTGALVWSQIAVAPAPDGSYDHVVTTGALTNEVTYKWRSRFTDAMGRQGGWSAYQLFKVSQPPSAAGTAPADAAVVTESTPTLDWSFSSPGGKTQFSYRVQVFDKGPTGANFADEVQVWDSGETISTDPARDVPFGVLENNHDYRWQVTVKDTDQLSYVLA